jgi:hypothetical protein
MASTYSPLKIELIGDGEQVGTWGATTNVNLGTAIEEAIVGRATANFASDGDLTLTLINTPASQVARNFVLNVTSGVSLTVTRNLIVPAIEKPYIVQNNTTGAQSIVVKTALGTGVTVPNGKAAFVYTDGTNVVDAFNYLASFDVGTLSLSTLGSPFNANSQAITNVNIDSGAIDGTNIGANAVGTGAFSTLSATGDLTVGGNGAFNGTGQIKVPAGTTAERSGSPVDGMLRYNSDLDSFEGYADGLWGGIGGAQAGGAIVTNKATASVSYTIAVGENGFSVGPITIADGVTITVDSGQRWVVI